MKTIAPPPELATGRRVFPALVLPFDEAVDLSHEFAGRIYTWGDVRLPRKEVPVDVDHDGQAVGYGSGFVLTHDGIWCSIKVGDTGESLVQRGHFRLSPEILDGQITSVSLVVAGTPGFASARIYTPDGPAAVGFAASPGVYISSGSVAVDPSHPAEPEAVLRSAIDLGAHRREMYGLSMRAVDAEVAQVRAAWEDRQAELATLDDVAEEQRLIAGCVPVPRWPAHLPRRKAYDAYQAQQAAEAEADLKQQRILEDQQAREAEDRRILEDQQAAKAVAEDGVRAAREFAERMEQLEHKAERRPWWRRLIR